MNCRFCGSFYPDGNDSCPTCGRRPEEDPIGKLLSDNLPGSDSQGTDTRSSSASGKEYVEKPLTGAIVLILLGLAGAVYALLNSIFPLIGTALRGGRESFDNVQEVQVLGVSIMLILGVIGIIILAVRLVNNSKADKISHT